MRKIRFRAKCVPDSKYVGEWVDGGYVAPVEECKNQKEELIIRYLGGNTISTYHVMTDTVRQFTGFRDKNGVDIYEGDILRSDDYPFSDGDEKDNYLGIVFYDEEELMFQVMQFASRSCNRCGISNFINKAFYDMNIGNVEVVGNIWDNKGMFRNSDESITKWYNGD